MKDLIKEKKLNSVEKFIYNTCKSYCGEIKRVGDILVENPLDYKEQSSKSFLFPSLYKNSTIVLMELYYSEENKNHYLDFYVYNEKEEETYLIEFKRVRDRAVNEQCYLWPKEQWGKVNNQINRLKKKIVNKYLQNSGEIYRISFLSVLALLLKIQKI